LSIRSKLTAIMMLTTGIVLALAAGGVVASETIGVRRAMLQELEVLADVTGTNSVSALAFNDPVAARETLAALRSRPGIVIARSLSPNGSIFVTYARLERPGGSDQGAGREASNVDVARALRDSGYHEWGRRLVLVRRMTLEGDDSEFSVDRRRHVRRSLC